MARGRVTNPTNEEQIHGELFLWTPNAVIFAWLLVVPPQVGYNM
jgi:hypothetical protein